MTPSTSWAISAPNSVRSVVELGLGVLDDVVQQGGRDRLAVQMELRADARHAPRVVDEVLAGAAQLPAVAALGRLERPADEVAIDVGVVSLDGREQLLDEVLVMLFCAYDRHEPSVRAEGASSP